MRQIVVSESFVPVITPALLKLDIKNRKYFDQRRRPDPDFNPGDHVWVHSHVLSNAMQQRTSKLTACRDGPYM